MLFVFNNFWKNAFILLASWALYGVVGYEFAVITLLSCILCRLMFYSPVN